MKTKIIFFWCQFSLLILLINSCCKHDSYEYVDNNMKLQYHEGDTLIYQDKNDNKDTLFLVQIEQGFAKVSNEDNCNTFDNKEYIYYYFDTINVKPTVPNTVIDIGYSIRLNNSNIFNLLWQKDQFINYKETSQSIDSITINNKKYTNILKLNQGVYSKKIMTVFYHFKLGVIRYQTLDNNTWNLINQYVK